jgi:predicted MPP superfamily phosphohydrolase
VCIEPYWVRIREIEISDEPFASFFRANKTIFLSDIHVTNSGIRETLLLEKINQLSAEIILLGGDLVAWDGDYQAAFEFLGKVKARKGVYGVLGESDFQDNRKSCNFCHDFDKSSTPFSAKFLQNKAVYLSPNEPAIFGVDIGSLDPELRQKSGISVL